jgi:hypothetical protein
MRNQFATAWAGPIDGPVGIASWEWGVRYNTPAFARLHLAGTRKHASDDGGQAQSAFAETSQEGPAGNVCRQLLGCVADSVEHD